MSPGGTIIVAGGGPVGLATAIEARLAGFDATVIEPRMPPIDKACGEGLMPGAVTALRHLGVEPVGYELCGISYDDGTRTAVHRFAGSRGLGVRRTTLHQALVNRASEVGVEVVADKVTSIRPDDRGVTASTAGTAEFRADWLIGADGLHSTVRRLAGLRGRTQRTTRRRYGIRRHFAVEPWTDLVEVHWTQGVELYVTPVDSGTVGVAMLGPTHIDFAETLAAVPRLWSKLEGSSASSTVRGAGPLRQTSRRRRDGRILLVGDASGYVDALTGEGLRVGFAQAHAAIRSIAAAAPGEYEREWSRNTRDFRVLTSGLVFASSTPFRSRIVPAAAAAPWLFGSVVERLAR